MTKKKYLRQLRKALGSRVSAAKKEELIEYYAEMIDESYERGKTSREIFADLEDPKKVARDYFNAEEGDIDTDPSYEPRRRRAPESVRRARREYRDDGDYDRDDRDYDDGKKRKGVHPLLIILFFPFILAGFCVALGLSIAFIGIMLADVAVTVALFVGGVYSIGMSFGLIPANGMIAVTQIGAGIVLIGVSLLFGMTIKWAAKGVGVWFKLLFRICGGKKSDGGRYKERSYGWIRTLCFGMAFLIIGGAVGAFGFGSLDWNWRRLADVGDFTEKEEAIELPENGLTVNLDNSAICVVATDGDAKISYYESNAFNVNYSYEDGTINLDNEAWMNRPWSHVKESWKRGIMYTAVLSEYQKTTLYVPASYTGSLTVVTQNGVCSVEGLTLADVKAETKNGVVTVSGCTFASLEASSNNGLVTVKDTTVSGEAKISSHNGAVKLQTVTASSIVAETSNGLIRLQEVTAHTVSAKTSNGAVKCEFVEGDELSFVSHNGAIYGSLVGKAEQFKIDASTGLGTCNLKNTDTGDKTIYARTGNGAIKIHFVERAAE